MENRRQVQMLQKLKTQAIRTKERNLAERRFLDRKLQSIAFRQRMSDHLIEKEVKELRDSLRRQALLAQAASDDDDSDAETLSLPSIHSPVISKISTRTRSPAKDTNGPRGGLSLSMDTGWSSGFRSESNAEVTSSANSNSSRARSGSGTAPWSRRCRRRDEPACQYVSRTRCRHFPCVAPSSHTPLGYEVDLSRRTAEAVSTACLVSPAHRERLLAELENNSVRRPLRSSMDQCVQKEQSLRKIISELKVRSEAGRPPDWCTNYGTPTSHRKLYKVARPSAGSEDLAGL